MLCARSSHGKPWCRADCGIDFGGYRHRVMPGTSFCACTATALSADRTLSPGLRTALHCRRHRLFRCKSPQHGDSRTLRQEQDLHLRSPLRHTRKRHNDSRCRCYYRRKTPSTDCQSARLRLSDSYRRQHCRLRQTAANCATYSALLLRPSKISQKQRHTISALHRAQSIHRHRSQKRHPTVG